MDVRGCQDHCSSRMLNLGQLLREIRNVMIVDQRQRSDDRLVRFNNRRKQRIAYQIPESFGAIAVSALGNEPVEFS
jgi:hypothetical protein